MQTSTSRLFTLSRNISVIRRKARRDDFSSYASPIFPTSPARRNSCWSGPYILFECTGLSSQHLMLASLLSALRTSRPWSRISLLADPGPQMYRILANFLSSLLQIIKIQSYPQWDNCGNPQPVLCRYWWLFFFCFFLWFILRYFIFKTKCKMKIICGFATRRGTKAVFPQLRQRSRRLVACIRAEKSIARVKRDRVT